MHLKNILAYTTLALLSVQGQAEEPIRQVGTPAKNNQAIVENFFVKEPLPSPVVSLTDGSPSPSAKLMESEPILYLTYPDPLPRELHIPDPVTPRAIPLPLRKDQCLSLNDAELYALCNNPTILAGYYASKSGYYSYNATIGEYLPHITFDYRYFRTPRLSNPTEFFPYGTFQTSVLTFLQEIVNTDFIYNIKIAGLSFARSRVLLRQTMANVLFDVRNFYYMMLFDMQLIDILEHYLYYLDEQLKLIIHAHDERVRERKQREEREKAGQEVIGEPELYGPFVAHMTPETEQQIFEYNKLTTLGFIAQAKQLLYNSQQLLEGDRIGFLNTLGVEPDTPFCIDQTQIDVNFFDLLREKFAYGKTVDPQVPLFSSNDFHRWQQLALDYSPDIETQAYNVWIAENQTARFEAEYIPHVFFFANFNNLGGRLQVIPNSSWNFGIDCNWDIFNGFTRENSVKQFKMTTASASWFYRQAILDADSTIATSISLIDENIKAYLASEAGALESYRGLEYAIALARKGLIAPISYRDVLNIWVQTLQAQNRSALTIVLGYFGIVRAAGLDFCELEHSCYLSDLLRLY